MKKFRNYFKKVIAGTLAVTLTAGVLYFTDTVAAVEAATDVTATENTTKKVPEKPAGNKDYADVLRVNRNRTDKLKYENGILQSTEAVENNRMLFEKSGVTSSDFEVLDKTKSYVFGLDITIDEDNTSLSNATGPGITVGSAGNTAFGVYLYPANIGLYKQDGTCIWSKEFTREAGRKYRIDILVEPSEEADTMSVWIDGTLFAEDQELPGREKAYAGVRFDQIKATVSNIDLYYVDSEENPTVPQKPDGNKDYADKNVISCAKCTYEEGVLKSADASSNNRRMLIRNNTDTDFNVLDVAKSYVYGLNLKIEATTNNYGPGITVGDVSDNPLQVDFLKDTVTLRYRNGTSVGDTIWSVPFNRELGKEYRVDILISTEGTQDTLSLWVDDGFLGMTDLPERTNTRAGVRFEYVQAEVTDLDLYYTEPAKETIYAGDPEKNEGQLPLTAEAGKELPTGDIASEDGLVQLYIRDWRENDKVITTYEEGSNPTAIVIDKKMLDVKVQTKEDVKAYGNYFTGLDEKERVVVEEKKENNGEITVSKDTKGNLTFTVKKSRNFICYLLNGTAHTASASGSAIGYNAKLLGPEGLSPADTFVYMTDFVIEGKGNVWFTFRSPNINHSMAAQSGIQITSDKVNVMILGATLKTAAGNYEDGKKHTLKVVSASDKVSVWIDDTQIFEDVDYDLDAVVQTTNEGKLEFGSGANGMKYENDEYSYRDQTLTDSTMYPAFGFFTTASYTMTISNPVLYKQDPDIEAKRVARFIGSLNAVEGYAEGGFFLSTKTSEESELNFDGNCKKITGIKTAYTGLYAKGTLYSAGTVYDDYSEYMFAYDIGGMPTGKKVYARAYVKLSDGTTILGAVREITID